VRRALSGLPGVRRVEISLEKEQALVEYTGTDPSTLPPAVEQTVLFPRLRRLLEALARH
jgi:copper chaperone CopZ